MKQYPTYKDSGIQWIGEIPGHWDVKKLKYFAQISNGQDQKEVLSDEGTYPILGTGGIFGRATKFLYDKPSVLLGRKGTIDNPFYIEEPFWTVDTLFYTRIHKGVFPKYFYYSCRCIDFDKYKTGSAVPSMTQDTLLNIHRVYPPLPEQIIIATFLDKKTSEIDQLIVAKEELITKLEAQRKAIINEAVTGQAYKTGMICPPEGKELKYKDSGIDWIGEIPQNWGVKKLKYLLESLDHKRIPLSSEERADMDKIYDYYGASGIIDKVGDYLFDESLILIGEDGANLLSRSSRLAFIAKGRYWVNNHAHILKPKSGNINYFCELLDLIDYTPYISGSAQPKLTQDELSNIMLINPPEIEQIEIGNFISKKLTEINQLIIDIKESISKLKQYKQYLISEAVTGKIDVREWQKDETNKIKNL